MILISFFCVFLAAIPAHARDKFLDIQEIKSPSGISAWLVEDHSMPIISLQFAFRGAGAAQEPLEKQGLSRLLSNTLDEGAGDLDSQAFQKTLTDHSISLGFGSGRDDFTGSLRTLTRHKDTAFQLLQLALTKPRFDPEAIERMRAANIARIQSSLSDPEWIAARIMNDLAFAGHPYAQNSGGTLTSLKTLNADDLKKFAATKLAKDNLLVGVAGDITSEELKTILDQIFGSLPDAANVAPIQDIKVQHGGSVNVMEKDIPQTVISIMQNGIARKDPDYYAAQVMDFIYGGSGFGSRLTEEVREKRGLVYGIDSGLDMMDHAKLYSVSSATKNESVAEVLSLVQQEAHKMRNKPVSEKELKDAKAYLTGALPLTLTSTDRIAGTVLSLRTQDLPIDTLDTRNAAIEKVTIADIQRVAQRLLEPDNLTVVLVGKPANIKDAKIVTTLPNVE
jgi:zinc protease